MPETIDVLGFAIDTRKPSELIDNLASSVIKNKKVTRVLQINPEIIAAIKANPDHEKYIESVEHIVPNGVGVQWAATYNQMKARVVPLAKTLCWIIFSPERLSSPLSERYTSSSFTAPLLKKLGSLDKPIRILIAGSPKNSSIETTAAKIRELGQNLQVTSFDTSNFDDLKLNKLDKLVAKASPNVVIIATGYPTQEKAAAKIQKSLKSGLILTEGGTFDYTLFGGKIKRANSLIQYVGLEWLWRLILEPSRLKRQSVLLRYIRLVYKNHK